jgi:hypothetical protein
MVAAAGARVVPYQRLSGHKRSTCYVWRVRQQVRAQAAASTTVRWLRPAGEAFEERHALVACPISIPSGAENAAHRGGPQVSRASCPQFFSAFG